MAHILCRPHNAQAAKPTHLLGHKSEVRSEDRFLHSFWKEELGPRRQEGLGKLPAPSLPLATMALGPSPYIAHTAHSGVAIVDSCDVVMVAEIKAGLEFLLFKLKCSFL